LEVTGRPHETPLSCAGREHSLKLVGAHVCRAGRVKYRAQAASSVTCVRTERSPQASGRSVSHALAPAQRATKASSLFFPGSGLQRWYRWTQANRNSTSAPWRWVQPSTSARPMHVSLTTTADSSAQHTGQAHCAPCARAITCSPVTSARSADLQPPAGCC